MTTVTGSTTAATTATTATTAGSSNLTATQQQDRFLKLLVTQMQNQDPLNPMDNAQLTSQMAQISTVTGLENLNNSMSGMTSQFVALQAMQAASLVGRNVAIEGNDLRMNDGVADGGYELSTDAEKVKIEIRSASNEVIDTIELTGVEAGRQSFTWEVPEAYREQALTFSVTATGTTGEIETMPLSYQSIQAVSNFGDTLALELSNGSRIASDAIWAFL